MEMINGLLLKGVPATLWHVRLRLFLGAWLVLTSMAFQPVSGAPKPGSVDLSFDARLGPGTSVSSLVLLPDGRMLISGLFTWPEPRPAHHFLAGIKAWRMGSTHLSCFISQRIKSLSNCQ